MGFILTPMGNLQCPHGGVAPMSSLVGQPASTIGGQMVLTMNSIGPVPFSCPFAQAPCVTVTAWQPNQTKIKIKNQIALTTDSIPMTNGGPGRVIDAGQVKWKV